MGRDGFELFTGAVFLATLTTIESTTLVVGGESTSTEWLIGTLMSAALSTSFLTAFTAAAVLSCGPSALFKVITGTVVVVDGGSGFSALTTGLEATKFTRLLEATSVVLLLPDVDGAFVICGRATENRAPPELNFSMLPAMAIWPPPAELIICPLLGIYEADETRLLKFKLIVFALDVRTGFTEACSREWWLLVRGELGAEWVIRGPPDDERCSLLMDASILD